MTGRSVSTADFLADSNISVDANIAFVESFTIMGECEEGKIARQNIEAKRDLATQEIQEESKKFEKSKVLLQLRERQSFTKPSVKRRSQILKAVYRQNIASGKIEG